MGTQSSLMEGRSGLCKKLCKLHLCIYSAPACFISCWGIFRERDRPPRALNIFPKRNSAHFWTKGPPSPSKRAKDLLQLYQKERQFDHTLSAKCLSRKSSLRLSGDFPGGSVVKNPPVKAGDTGLIPEMGRSHMPQNNKALHHNYY